MAKGKQGRRRSHLALKPRALTPCGNCKKPIAPHTVCKYCGHYKGRQVVNVLAKALAKQEKKKHQARK
jgi:large subunit ribosomal protein L32